jgi:hypothetical protein
LHKVYIYLGRAIFKMRFYVIFIKNDITVIISTNLHLVTNFLIILNI